MKQSTFYLTALVAPLVHAFLPPNVDGMNMIWSDAFQGAAGSLPNLDAWNIALHINTNNEVQDYTDSNANMQLSGGDTLQLVPLKSEDGQWTSGRVESQGSWTPQPGRKMLFQGALRIGSAANKQGIWPAFWMLGDAMRHGTEWPLCGELDIYEQVNGIMTGHGTVHCGTMPDGPCNEPSGRSQPTTIPDNEFHTWAVSVDRTSGNWQTETISWLMDGNTYHVLSGAEIGDEGTWGTLAHSPMYLLLNVAVGGDWPGNPDDLTEAGWGSMLEVGYVAIYESS